jgi:hypothetical protein
MYQQSINRLWKIPITFQQKQAMIFMAILGFALLMPIPAWAAGPGGVNSGLQLWLKADAGTSTTTNGAGVSSWADQSPATRTASQGSSQPTFVTDAFNFNPALGFNGSASNKLNLNSLTGLPAGSGNRTMIAVASYTYASNNNPVLFFYGQPTLATNSSLTIVATSKRISLEGGLSRYIASTLTVATPSILSGVYTSSNKGYLYANGTVDSASPSTLPTAWNTIITGGLAVGVIGDNPWAPTLDSWNGNIAEIIVYSTALNGTTDLQKIESYLALKYGITLNSTINYLASDSTVIYPSTGTHSGYINDITGIGRDDNAALEQRKSKSIETDAIVTIEHSSAFSSDQQFLIWGNDNGATTEQATELPANISDRLGREWKIAEANGDVGDIVLTMDVNSLGLTGNAATLLIDSDGDGDFTTGTITRIGADTYVSGIATFTTNLGDGDVFTLATGCAGMLPNNVVDNILGNLEDCDNSAGNNTLLEAILYANAGDTITFDPSIAGQTITLTNQLTIDKNLTIDGTGQNITISGGGTTQVFEVTAGTVVFDSLTIADGNASGSNGGGVSTGIGTDVTMINSILTNNSADYGGAINNDGGNITIKNSILSNNTATTEGGGVNSNSASNGNITITNSTFSGNTATSGGGLTNGSLSTLNFSNTIIANNNGGDCYDNGGTISTNTNNLIEDGSCSATLSGDPLLGSLQDNGGNTQTMALLPGSPAINAGDNGTCEASDKRGITRPQTATCDIGAYEKQAPAFTSTAVTSVIVNDAYSYNITTTDNEPTDGASPVITAPILPAWLTLTDNGDGTGTLTGTPTQTEVGTHNVTLRLNDGTENIDQIFIITVNKIEQTISFDSLSDRTGNTDFTVSATATSGLSVSFSASGNCTVSDNTVTLSRSGSCTITASQVGDGEYNAAPDVSQSFTIEAPIPNYKLTITQPSGGTISGEGISCGSDCNQYFDRGTRVTLTANPRANFVLVAWEGDCDETGTVVINEDKTCTAQFLPPNLNVSASTLNFTEGENAASYSVWLNTPPNALVTITLTSDDDDLVLSQDTLIFEPDNWNVPQTVEINHVDDDIMQGNHEHQISHTVTSDDPSYDGLIIDDVSVILTDNDAPGIHLSNYEVTVTEGQSDASYNITLTTQPFNSVTIQLNTTESDNEQDSTLLSPQTLVFTIDNWDIPQEILLSVVDDHIGEGAHDHTPIEHQVISDDATYDGFFISDVIVHVIDNDEPNITLSSYQLNVTEEGSTDQTERRFYHQRYECAERTRNCV